MSTRFKERLQSFAPVPLRLILGFGFIFHGYPKLFTAEGHESFAGMLAGIGVPWSQLNAYLIGGFEFFGGILLMLGVGVRVIGALGIAEMAVAALAVHWPAGFNFMNVTGVTEDGAMQFGLPGYEVNLLYIAGFVSLILSGPGELALGPAVTGATEEPRSREVDEPSYVG